MSILSGRPATDAELRKLRKDAKHDKPVKQPELPGTECAECSGIGFLTREGDIHDCPKCHGMSKREKEEENTMAAKKKIAKKSTGKATKTAKVKAPKVVKEKVVREPGRECKMLLRLSHTEYANLEALSAKQERPMAQILRDICQ